MRKASTEEFDSFIKNTTRVAEQEYIFSNIKFILFEEENLSIIDTLGDIKKYFEKQIASDEKIYSFGSDGEKYFALIDKKGECDE